MLIVIMQINLILIKFNKIIQSFLRTLTKFIKFNQYLDYFIVIIYF